MQKKIKQQYPKQQKSSSLENNTSLDVGKLFTGVEGLNSIVDGYMNNSSIANTDTIEGRINRRLYNDYSNINNNKSLLNTWGNDTNLSNVSYGDVRGMSEGQQGLNTLSTTASGATAGFNVGGPIGAIVGGGLGLVSGLLGSSAGYNKAKGEQQRLNKLTTNANNVALSNFINSANSIESNNDNMLLRNHFAQGGNVYNQNEDIVEYQNGGTHEQNPYGGVPISMDQNGQPNMVEEGEVKYKDYIFSNRIPFDPSNLQMFGIKRNFANKSFADVAKEIKKESEERPNDSISKRGLEANMNKLQQLQEYIKQQTLNNTAMQEGNKYAFGGSDFLRYAPAIGTGLQTLTDLAGITNKEDLSGYNRLVSSNKYNTFTPNLHLDRMQYNREDPTYLINRIQAQNNSVNNAIQNNAAGNGNIAINGLMAQSLNQQAGMTDAYLKMKQMNEAKRNQALQFNNGVEVQENQAYSQSHQMNQQGLQAYIQNMMRNEALKNQIINKTAQARSANRNAFLNNLGNIGKELQTIDMINNNPAFAFYADMAYKGMQNNNYGREKKPKNSNLRGGKKKKKQTKV